MPVGSLALACKFQTAERWGGEGERFSPESPQLAGTALPAPGEPGGCQRQGGLALPTGHPAPTAEARERVGDSRPQPGPPLTPFSSVRRAFVPSPATDAWRGNVETESRAQAQAGPGRAVALRPAPGTRLPTRRQNCSLKVRSLRCPLWPAPTLEGIALKSESVCGTQASPGECGSCWGLRLETGGPVLPSDGPRRV